MRNSEYQFTDAGIEALEARLVQDYENFSGAAVQPGSPERVIIQWVASILTHERALMNYIGNQNLPSRAEGENLDALAELMYLPKRPQAAAAVCTQRFHISEPQQSAILVPKGTRVTSSGGPIFWRVLPTTKSTRRSFRRTEKYRLNSCRRACPEVCRCWARTAKFPRSSSQPSAATPPRQRSPKTRTFCG